MKKNNIPRVISIICSVICLAATSYGLLVGLLGLSATEWPDALNTIFLLPSLIIFPICLFDFLIATDKIKKGLVFSCVNSIIKVGIIIVIFINARYRNLSDFEVLAIVFFTIMSITSIINMLKLAK